MKTKVKEKVSSAKADNSLASLVEAKLKGKEPFAEKIETIKDYLNKVKVSAL